jgi:Ca2+-binding EF-hand superfamily protein
MKNCLVSLRPLSLVVLLAGALAAGAQAPGNPPSPDGAPPPGMGFPPPDGPPGFDGPPPFGPDGFGPGGPGPGGPGGMMAEKKLVKQFDENGDGWLNREERKAAREFLSQQGDNRGRGGPRGPGGFGRRGGKETPPQPGRKLTPADVPSFPDAPLYASNVLRTFFLEFENADWEKELADFKSTDVDVPAKLTVDGKAYPDVGVHFHGASSYFMVGEGQKRSLVVSLDFIHAGQQLGGYRKLNLLNSHEDPSFLRTVLSLQIARAYLPSPKANFARVVINGESWGVYVNQQHFNKDLVDDGFGTTKGARWKVPGSPNGHGGLNYLGEDAAAYKRIYELKSKEDKKSWADLIQLCKVLDETPSSQLEKALTPLLDIDGALRFLAWDNALANGDGFWTRASDFDLYEDPGGRFHIIPYDANETFSSGGGPGGFGPGMLVAEQMLSQGDKNGDQKLSQEEFSALADTWFDKLDADKSGKLSQTQFAAKLPDVLPPPQGRGGFGPPGGGGQGGGQRGGGRGGFGPAMFLATPLFAAMDADQDGAVTRQELKDTFAGWFAKWATNTAGELTQTELRDGLNAALPRPNFGGPRGGRGRGGPGGGGPGGGGTELDPLANVRDTSKPLLSKMLAVPALRARYLSYVRDIAERWLDWSRLGPIATQYQALIADEVKADTRKLESFAAFQQSLADEAAQAGNSRGPGGGSSLKRFAELRRAYLLKYREVAASPTAKAN